MPATAQQITSVVETGGDNKAAYTISAKWTGQTFPVSVNAEPAPQSVTGDSITVGGFGDRAPAFIDRNHRYINSTSVLNPPDPPVDIPAYLLGLPYIMSGNDNRENASYRPMPITRSTPAPWACWDSTRSPSAKRLSASK